MGWTISEAIALCRAIEAICPAFGCHVALTGGTLYKDGVRKDLDLVFYRIRQCAEIDVDGLFDELTTIGITRITGDQSWCIRALHKHERIDCFFPEAEEGDYDGDETEHRATFAPSEESP